MSCGIRKPLPTYTASLKLKARTTLAYLRNQNSKKIVRMSNLKPNILHKGPHIKATNLRLKVV